MKGTILADQRYKITIDGIEHAGFKKVSEWEGMGKFENEDGVVIVELGSTPGQDFCNRVFGEFLNIKPAPVEVEVLKISPRLVAAGK